MATENKTKQTDSSVLDFVQSLGDEQVASDCLELIAMMHKVSGHEPKMWGPSIIGFDAYHYKYASGHEGDAPVIAFSPRKGKLTIYADDTSKYTELLAALGKHSTGKVCIYIKRLSDIDMSVLTKIMQQSYKATKLLAESYNK